MQKERKLINVSFHLAAHSFILPGISSEEALSAWAQSGRPIDAKAEILFDKKLPMMAARRLDKGTRLALEVSLSLLEGRKADALVFSSRHGELPKSEKLLSIIQQGRDVSPTDFSMSVHNAAAGTLTIREKLCIPSASISSGADSFHSGLIEAYGQLCSGAESVLLIDFENPMPPMLGDSFDHKFEPFYYAFGCLLTKGKDISIDMEYQLEEEPSEPSSLQLLRALSLRSPQFCTYGASTRFNWRCHG